MSESKEEKKNDIRKTNSDINDSEDDDEGEGEDIVADTFDLKIKRHVTINYQYKRQKTIMMMKGALFIADS